MRREDENIVQSFEHMLFNISGAPLVDFILESIAKKLFGNKIYTYSCPNCNQQVHGTEIKICPNCGVSLTWKEK